MNNDCSKLTYKLGQRCASGEVSLRQFPQDPLFWSGYFSAVADQPGHSLWGDIGTRYAKGEFSMEKPPTNMAFWHAVRIELARQEREICPHRTRILGVNALPDSELDEDGREYAEHCIELDEDRRMVRFDDVRDRLELEPGELQTRGDRSGIYSFLLHQSRPVSRAHAAGA